MNRVNQRRIDPNTHIVYNLESNIPQDANIRKRLVQKFGDDKEIFKERIRRYNAKIGPVLEYYKLHTKVVHIDASQSLQQVQDQIENAVNALYHSNNTKDS